MSNFDNLKELYTSQDTAGQVIILDALLANKGFADLLAKHPAQKQEFLDWQAELHLELKAEQEAMVKNLIRMIEELTLEQRVNVVTALRANNEFAWFFDRQPEEGQAELHQELAQEAA